MPKHVELTIARLDARLKARAIRLRKALAAHELSVAGLLMVEIDTLLDMRLEVAR